MAVEIERKFLLREAPMQHVADRHGEELRQGYLAIDHEVEVRVRITPTAATVTIKAGRGVSRTEVEMPVAAREAEDLWMHTVDRRIEKTRYRVDLHESSSDRDRRVAEVDIYHGDLKGLFVVEVEFEDEAAAAVFVPPDWFGQEVSGDARWSNAELARHGKPEEFIDGSS